MTRRHGDAGTGVESPRPRVRASPRPLLIALAVLLAAPRLEAQLTPPELEDAAEAARRAAFAACRGPQRVFTDALDVEGILVPRLTQSTWNGLSERQRERLRAFIRERFLQALAPPRGVPTDVVWSAARAESGRPAIALGIRFGEKTLKTKWNLVRASGDWRVADVWLVDPGMSLARASTRALGPEPVRRRDGVREARAQAVPRLAGIALIALLVLLAAQRLAPPRRALLLMTAAAPAILLAGDGFLAARRALKEPFVVVENLPPEPWESPSRLAFAAEREGRLEQARAEWSRALAAGGDPGPIEYEIGLGYRERGDGAEASSFFRRALGERRPAPGAARELAALAAAAGRREEARQFLDRYFALAGPDPESLALAAAVEMGLGRNDEALESIRQARLMLGDGERSAELEAKIHAVNGDAAATVAALRPLAAQGRLDRSLLRANPDFLPIATDPAWIAFLNERPPAPRPAPAGSSTPPAAASEKPRS